ncbi:hypothetical protein HYDPIDRAFT_140425 [Hydnomerulius pinastri MD-312]|uniref:Ferric reductase NAD binding domain-containing protein n=1 Tax=Hydnomerulius pinastri MD-312 TaxID=994086 RepID=A0A0C9VPQ0_9AGAM|nr:hypothetical protein HYDPIDRAFT_140425 [Hydnomerulius pinastri MD-312]
MGALNGWHKGERVIQRKLGFDGVVSQSWAAIHPEMTEQHQRFHTTRLPFIPITTLDEKQRPWSSILAGHDGKPGFATSNHFGELTMHAGVWEGDPFAENVKASNDQPMLIAGIGVEFSTRRRNKFAGYIESIERDGSSLHVRSVVNEALGNCPKYINIREFVPYPNTKPRIVHRSLELSATERLPDDVISLIHESDTLFLGTVYKASETDRERFPSHAGMNHRGGKAGFVRVRPSDGRTIVLPDYSGNRLMTSLGNIEATPLAGVTFVSFTTGSILYLTGNAQNIVGPEAQRIMPRTNALTTVYVTGFVFVTNALPVRQKPGTSVQPSPYSPPIRLLAEETSSKYFDGLADQLTVTLASIELHSPDLATFTFQYSNPLDIVPGQTAILDFKSFVGSSPYKHMAPDDPKAVNDDRIRTWTISYSSSWSEPLSSKKDGPSTFALTMRHKPGGAVTGALFSIANKLAEVRPELLKDSRPLEMGVPLVGIAGDFTLSAPTDSHSQQPRKLLWVAGGIGLTPFLAMLAGLRRKGEEKEVDITLVLSTREPDMLLPLIMRSAQPNETSETTNSVNLTIHVFSRSPLSPATPPDMTTQTGLSVSVEHHAGRLDKTSFLSLGIEDAAAREVFVCGPEDFEKVVIGALQEVGVVSQKVKREGFAY